MILEAVRIHSRWFADATNGANAMLAALTLDESDSRPGPFETIVDEMSDGDVARDSLPAASSSLSVSCDAVRNLDGIVQVITGEGDVQMRIRAAVDNAKTADARVDISYRLRAALRSFRLLMRDDHAAARTRNGIYLETCSQITTAIETVRDPDGNPFIVGYLLPTIRLRELTPYG